MRRLVMPMAGVVVGILVLGACGSGSSGKAKTASGTNTAGAPVQLQGKVNDKGTADATGKSSIEIEADDYYFKPTFVKAAAGSTVSIELSNEAKQAHTFTIDGAVDQMLSPGQKMTVQVKVPASGALNFYCRSHRSLGMQGGIFSATGQSIVAASGRGGVSGGGAATTASTAASTTSSSSSGGYGY